MKRPWLLLILVILIILLIFFWRHQQATEPLGLAQLDVSFSGLVLKKGMVYAAVCPQADFLKKCPWNQRGPVSPQGEAQLRFENLPAGRYAVMAYQDENGSGELKTSANGIPLQAYGFSRDARGQYGPPRFEDAMVQLKPGPNLILITLHY